MIRIYSGLTLTKPLTDILRCQVHRKLRRSRTSMALRVPYRKVRIIHFCSFPNGAGQGSGLRGAPLSPAAWHRPDRADGRSRDGAAWGSGRAVPAFPVGERDEASARFPSLWLAGQTDEAERRFHKMRFFLF